MIQLLATKYNKQIACLLGFIFYVSWVLPVYGRAANNKPVSKRIFYSGNSSRPSASFKTAPVKQPVVAPNDRKDVPLINNAITAAENKKQEHKKISNETDKTDIDGPSQPEMSSFKPAGTNDMVNLFTGDFNYNIPLMTVGSYPVNIFYDGGIGMEQEASWVGLGWNLNPGNINRNMRGVPDDFDGTEKLIQEQNMKKNVTWGVSLGADWESFGIKGLNLGGGVSLGFSVNNHLGPAIEIGGNLSAGFNLSKLAKSEKYAVGASVGLDLNLSSRSGLTISPDVSLTVKDKKISDGLNSGTLRLSTSYNSRSGIKALQLSGQMSYNKSVIRGAWLGKWPLIQAGSASISESMLSTSISFTKPSYVPSMRASITNSSGAGRFQLGPGWFGQYPSVNVKGYGQVSKIEPADRHVEKPMVGFIYADKAKGNRDAVMDFTRFNDQEVTPKTTVISVPQYAFDVFSIQGEGTGGTIRAYRGDNGYVRDNYITSKDKSWSAGADIGSPMPQLHGLPGHWGGNFNTIKTPSTSGDWKNGNKLSSTIGFGTNSKNRENVYFRNPGENSVLNPNQYDSIGGADLVRYKIGGTKPLPTVEPVLQKISPSGSLMNEISVQRSIGIPERKKRTQVTSFLTAAEAKEIGIDKKIKNYDAVNPLDANKNLNYTEIDRDAGFRRGNHISQFNVTEADGKTYFFGVPVYNLKQIDFSFTVKDDCDTCDRVPFYAGEETINSDHINSGTGGKDGYVQRTETPPYAHSFLLSGLVSPDYVDVTGDGITEDDLGGAVKFNYTRTGTHKWRTPLTETREANSNPGKLSERKDDKGLVSYGERESWYLHSIESQNMIAFFILADRFDGKGAVDSVTGINFSDNSVKKLSRIDLYNKADLKKNGLALAKPVKSVHFGYSYALCDKTPDNQSGGKLTLDSIWFTYNGQARANKNRYIFSYTKSAVAATGENPDYEFNGTDRWGNYKPRAENPANMKNRDYPYPIQDKTKADAFANAWNLKRILLPSGGQIEVEYESDDYAFVQNKRAAVMSEIIGFSHNESNPVNNLFSVNGVLPGVPVIRENNYMFIKVPIACTSKTEVYERYLKDVSQIAVRFLVNMPKGPEYLTSYATFSDYGVYTSGSGPAIWVKMNMVNGSSPLSQTAIEFLREQLPGQAFPGYDVSDDQGIKQVLTMLEGWWQGIRSAFSDIPKYLKGRGLAQTVQVNKSFARLNDPDGFKYGGGHRVKKVLLRDNWKKMTSPGDPNQGYTSVYGKEYDYTTTEVFNGVQRTISSGVASYEPSLGGEENPFQTIVQVVNEVPLGPSSYGAIEMPVMDAFFPAPVVGYSKVTVTSIGKKQNPDSANSKTRSGVGRQVTEFYTAKDFPVYYNHTKLDPASDVQHHVNFSAVFYNYARDSRALSQGFLVTTNDMHGKMKSQSSYAENDPTTRINYTENFYRNTGVNGFGEQFDFVHNKKSGEIIPGNMGIDIELMTDAREFTVKSTGVELQGQVDNIVPPVPELGWPGIWLPTLWPVVSDSKNSYYAVTATKVISYHSVLDSVVVIDKGSQVSTKNMVYDAETGQVIINRTNNEFDKPIYSVTYPAYWAYSGMGLAYKNIDAVYSGVTFYDGKITAGMDQVEIDTIFESGDELYIMQAGGDPGCDPVMLSPSGHIRIWALDTAKNTSSLTNTTPSFIFIDKDGKPYTKSGVKFRIVRSGHRNMLGTSLAGVTMMTNPVVNTAGARKIIINSNSKVINASAVEFKEKWQTDNDVFKKYKLVPGQNGPELITNGNFSGGNNNTFSSQYQYSPAAGSGINDGRYNVAAATDPWYPPFADCGDHTSGTGNMMMVNGAQSTINVWKSQTISVTPNTNYRLSAWAASIAAGSPANLQFKINGIQTGSNLQLTSSTCSWTNFQSSWNSGLATTAEIIIVDLNTNWDGNDFVLDDISFYEDNSCSFTEVEDCSGYLEKRINPYRQGLLGNFRGYRSMVFYGERMESNPSASTNLPVNGYLKDFSLYWNFNASNNLIPDLSPGSKWVWNAQSTRFNAKGLEVETKDALGIYTSAQYGYLKTIPVAIANNSRSDEMFYDGFEDYDYRETLNGAVYNQCVKKHIDFSNLSGGQIIKAENYGFKAHSGRSVFNVNPQNSVTKDIPIVSSPDHDYNLRFQPRTVPGLYELGGDSTWYNVNPLLSPDPYSNYYLNNCMKPYVGAIFGDLSAAVASPFQTNNSNCYSGVWNIVHVAVKTTQYIQITQRQNYAFVIKEHNLYAQGYTNHPSTANFLSGTLVISKALDNEQLGVYTSPASVLQVSEYVNESILNYNIDLCPGVYKLEFTVYNTLSSVIEQEFIGCISSQVSYSFATSLTSYKSLQTQNVCSYTAPIVGKDSMMNPVFFIPADKKMLFSAWVKETCGNPQGGIPCRKTAYTDNEVQIDFGAGNANNVTLKPTGPIIEGWQRYEGYFTAPAGVNTMNLKFVNSSGSPVYFDDIRIHRFNANMKSYVYDPVNLRLTSQLDANNYASYFEYDEEGTLIRTKVETSQGIKTVTESRSAKQKDIKDFQ